MNRCRSYGIPKASPKNSPAHRKFTESSLMLDRSTSTNQDYMYLLKTKQFPVIAEQLDLGFP
jgi:hypothetical protein